MQTADENSQLPAIAAASIVAVHECPLLAQSGHHDTLN
jgi:hypothetical protein